MKALLLLTCRAGGHRGDRRRVLVLDQTNIDKLKSEVSPLASTTGKLMSQEEKNPCFRFVSIRS